MLFFDVIEIEMVVVFLVTLEKGSLFQHKNSALQINRKSCC